jgi:TolB protein
MLRIGPTGADYYSQYKKWSSKVKIRLSSAFMMAAFAATPILPNSARAGTIVFQSNRAGNYEIYSMNADGSERRRLTNNLATDRNPALSHDGSKVAFVSNRDGSDDIYVMNSNGRNVVRLTFGVRDENPAWSPNDKEIAYESLSGLGFRIAIMQADGSGAYTVTPGGFDVQPSWSPDGMRIVFNHNYQIAVMNRDGTGTMLLTKLAGFNEWPHWSAQGKIVFHSTMSGAYQIYVMDANGSQLGRVTNDAASDVWPVWSPSGKSIAFQSNRDDINGDIYRMRADGSGLKRLTNNSNANDDFPSWAREQED